MVSGGWIPKNRCEFCSRRVQPNLPDESDQWIYVGPVRGQGKVIACMSWRGLKPGETPCGVRWQRMDKMFQTGGRK